MEKARIKQLISEELTKKRIRMLSENNPNEPVDAQVPASSADVSGPSLNAKKAHGIIVGALKTLINSGFLVGVDQSQIDALAPKVTQAISTIVNPSASGEAPEAKQAPASPEPAPSPSPEKTEPSDDIDTPAPPADTIPSDTTKFNDDVAYQDQEDDLDDQTQYDPDLDKQISKNDSESDSEEDEDEFDDEPLFEAKQLLKYFK